MPFTISGLECKIYMPAINQIKEAMQVIPQDVLDVQAATAKALGYTICYSNDGDVSYIRDPIGAVLWDSYIYRGSGMASLTHWTVRQSLRNNYKIYI